MIQITATVNSDDVKGAVTLFEFVGGNSDQAMSVAINRSIRKIKNRNASSGVSISSAIRQQVKLSAGYVKENLSEDFASRKKLTGRVKTPSRGLLLTRYSTVSAIAKGGKWLGPRPDVPARGIKVKVKPTGSPKTLSKEHFYMVLPTSQRLAIARRRASPGKKGGLIEVLYGPSLSQVLSQDTLREKVEPAASELYQEELLDAMRFVLAKKYPKE